MLTPDAGVALVKLALAAGRGSELAQTRASIVVDGRAADEAYARLGETVLVYLHVKDVILDFVGQGRIAGIGLGGGGERAVVLDPYAPFPVPVSGEAEREAPGARRMLELADGRFDAVMAQSIGTEPLQLGEVGAGLAPTPTEATYMAIRDQVLRVWRYRCAFTGRDDTPGAPLIIVAIRPRDRGGPLHVGNYLPMAPDLERAWRLGHFAVGEDHRILGDLYRLAPEEQDRMVALFRMLLPDDPKHYPDPDLLAWHRSNVFGRS
jgi:hypothetical protein